MIGFWGQKVEKKEKKELELLGFDLWCFRLWINDANHWATNLVDTME